MLDLVLEIDIFSAVSPLTRAIPDPPDQHDEDGHGNGNDKVDPDCWCDCEASCCCCFGKVSQSVHLALIYRVKREGLAANRGNCDVLSPTLKNTMLNTEASSVAGKKMAPRREMVFIWVLSRLPA